MSGEPQPILGTNVVSPIVPGTTADAFPTHDAKYGKGGFRSVQYYADLDTITDLRRDPGMFVYVIEEDSLYVYEIDSTTNEASWRVWSGGGGTPGDSWTVYSDSINALEEVPLIVVHNLGRYPSVTIRNSENEIIVGEVKYLDQNRVQLTFSENVTGTIYLN